MTIDPEIDLALMDKHDVKITPNEHDCVSYHVKIRSDDGIKRRWNEASATFSNDYRYRYTLERSWRQGGNQLVAIGLNPSTANAFRDDPTVRRWVDYATRWGFNGLVVVNVFAYRSTDPAKLRQTFDPIGPLNDEVIRMAASVSPMILCCWSNDGGYLDRGAIVERLLSGPEHRYRTYALGVTASGAPRHPLYVRADAEPAPYPPIDPAILAKVARPSVDTLGKLPWRFCRVCYRPLLGRYWHYDSQAPVEYVHPTCAQL